MMRVGRISVSAAVLILALISASLGVPAGSAVFQAQQLLASGRAAEACSLLETPGYANTADVEALVVLGLCHEELDMPEAAIRYYERALAVVPDAQLVRARLAALYAFEGRIAEADAALQTALAATAASSSEQSAGALAGRLSVHRLYDSNVNAGSSSETMTGVVFGVPLPMTIDPGSRGVGDSGTRLSFQGRHIHPLGSNHALLTSVGLGATIHDNLSQYDRQSIALGSGLIYNESPVVMMLQSSAAFSFEDGQLDAVRAALDATAERDLGQGVSVVAATGLAYRHNPQTTDRSAWDGQLSLGFRYALTENFEIGIAYGVRPTVSGRPTESYLAHGPEIGLTARLIEGVSFGLSYGYEHAIYDETSALFPVDRWEDRHRLAAELNADLSGHVAEGLALAARYEYSTTDSTLPLYDSERHVVSVGLTYSF